MAEARISSGLGGSFQVDFHGSREGFLKRPAVFESGVQCFVRNSHLSRPLCHCLSLSFICQQAIPAHIVCLVHCCRPSAICQPSFLQALPAFATRIVAIVVFTFNRMLRRRLSPQVDQERFKTSLPPLTHHDSAPSVPIIALISRVHDSGLYSLPAMIFKRFLTRACGPMFSCTITSCLSGKTPATFRVIMSQVCVNRPDQFSTFALTGARTMAVLFAREVGQEGQSAEFLTGGKFCGSNRSSHARRFLSCVVRFASALVTSGRPLFNITNRHIGGKRHG